MSGLASTKGRRLVGAVALVAVAAAVGIWLAMRPVPLDIQAKHIIEAVRRGDSSFLLDHLLAHEVREYGLDREKMKRFWDEVIQPNIAGYEHVGEAEWAISSGDGSSAMAISRMRAADGAQGSFALSVHRTPYGGRVSIEDMLLASWYLKHLGAGRDARAAFNARIAGIRSDRLKLERLGMRGFFPSDEPERLHTWEELETRYLGLIMEEERARSVENTVPISRN